MIHEPTLQQFRQIASLATKDTTNLAALFQHQTCPPAPPGHLPPSLLKALLPTRPVPRHHASRQPAPDCLCRRAGVPSDASCWRAALLPRRQHRLQRASQLEGKHAVRRRHPRQHRVGRPGRHRQQWWGTRPPSHHYRMHMDTHAYTHILKSPPAYPSVMRLAHRLSCCICLHSLALFVPRLPLVCSRHHL